MYIAMNRFKVAKDRAADFEALWNERDSYLHELDGFLGFHLLRGPEKDDHILYASHTVWRGHGEFLAWTKSEQFRKAHANAGGSSIRPLYLGHPEFEGFFAVQEVSESGENASSLWRWRMAEAAGTSALSRPVDGAVAARLATNPDGILEQIAAEHGVSTLEVVRALPEEHCKLIEGAHFERVMADIATWGEVLFLVHTPNIVLECRGSLPPGAFGRGYYNLHGNSPIGGHIKADRCVAIAFVTRPFMGRTSASVQFFDGEGAAMFKIFVARDAERALVPVQLDRFEALRAALDG